MCRPNDAEGPLYELEDGKNEFSEGTYPCTMYPGCLYQYHDRCMYNITRIKVPVSRACYEDLMQDEREAYLDLYD